MLKFIVNDNMPLENITEHIKAHKNAINKLDDLIKQWCVSHGHKWINLGRVMMDHTDGEWRDEGYDGPAYVTYVTHYYKWIRICKCCDKKEDKKGIEYDIPVNPFTGEEVPFDTAEYYSKGIHISVEMREKIARKTEEWILLCGKVSESERRAVKIKNEKEIEEWLDVPTTEISI